MTFKKLYKEYKNKPVLTFNGKDLSLYIDRDDFLSILEHGIFLENKLDKIKEYIKEEEYQEEGYGTLVIETKKLNELLEEIE